MAELAFKHEIAVHIANTRATADDGMLRVEEIERALVQTAHGVGDYGQMPRFPPVEELFKGRYHPLGN